ncbi:MAG: T9SS type A sorting domain-containing protein, partial [Bacteroidales bacterium]|nr:T9SS type A sorting domain-containing protein [Bacteroidales bacterium]
NKELTLDFNGEATLAAEEIDSGSYHGCYSVDLSLDKTLFTKDDIGVNTVTLTGTTSKGITGTCQSTVTVEASSVHELNISKLNIEVIPMPFNEMVTVKLSNELGNNTLLSILDLTGKVVFYEWINPISKELNINTEAFQPGVYILQIRNNNDLMIRKTVIKE